MTDQPVQSEIEELRLLFGHVKGEGRKMPWEITPEDVRRNEVALEILSARGQQKALDSFYQKIRHGVLAGTIDAAREEYLIGIYAEQAQAISERAAAFRAKHNAASREAPEPARREFLAPDNPVVAFTPSPPQQDRAATQADAESATVRLRKQLDGAADEATKIDDPQKASDFLKGRGRFRDRSYDR